MLKTNSKKAKENLKSYIINHFDYSNYEVETEPTTFEEVAQFIYRAFRSEKYSTLINIAVIILTTMLIIRPQTLSF